MPSDEPSILRRLILGVLCLLAAWIFYRQSIVPLRDRERDTQRKLADLRAQIGSASSMLDELRALRQGAALGAAALERLQGELPRGSVMAWFPTRVRQSFARSEIPVSSIRLNTAQPVPGLSRCESAFWHLVVPISSASRGITGLLFALSEIERQEPFVRVLDFSVNADPADPKRGTAAINMAVMAGEIPAGSDLR